ncbi:MAG: ABC transporter substrate-binding protein [Hydrogenophilaceae bacterium CG1_02_62_390]|nr:PhnD/SsuA/transferrin family substrate-binding protein [Betaproteobacteria bacterium]OIO79877.1 MAG: ABC transporter substrate-binding protein [Hydrogenophilaceae bacterium CG1_02_62_390]
MSRRKLLKVAATALLMPSLAVQAQAPLLFGTTPVILDEQAQFLERWRIYLETLLRRPMRFVQRGSYREIMTLLADAKLDCAWLCGYPYVQMKDRLDLVAVPVYAGQPSYRSYLIVPAEDRATRSILDLRGKVFAYSDPDSNSGWLVPQVELKRAGEDATRFFKKGFYTWGHRKVIEAVAAGLAHGGAVDGYIWDSLSRLHPEMTRATRVAWRSSLFGFPPIVARKGGDELNTLRQALLAMTRSPPGRMLLARLNLNGFTIGELHLFDSIQANWRYLEG